MRVVLIASHIAPLNGENLMVTSLAIALSECGTDVHVISLRKGQSVLTDNLEKAGIPIYYLNKKRGFDLRIMLSICSVIKRTKPDVIHTHGAALFHSILATKIAAVRRIFHTVHSVADKESPTAFRRFLSGVCFRFMGVIPVGLCPMVQKSIAELYGLPLTKVPYVYNGIDLSRCLSRNKTTHLGKEFRFLHVGRFSEEKNHAGLIEAFSIIHAKHPNARLDLIGKGELEDAARTQINALGLQDCVRMLGEKDDAFPFYALADAFVFPSLYEGFGLVLVEAMGTGPPVIASAIDGILDVLEDGVSGLLCTTEPKDIAAHMEALISDPALCERLGEAAKERAKMFSAQSMAEGYLRIYSGKV